MLILTIMSNEKIVGKCKKCPKRSTIHLIAKLTKIRDMYLQVQYLDFSQLQVSSKTMM